MEEVEAVGADRAGDEAAALEAHGFLAPVLPLGAIVRADAHRVDQADDPAQRAHVLRGTAAGEKDVGAGTLAQGFEAEAQGLDVGGGGIVERLVVAEIVLGVAVVDIDLLAAGAGPHPVHLEIIVSPAVDRLGQVADVVADRRFC